MAWTKSTVRIKPHHCRLPRIKRRHGHGSAWQCDTCSTVWEIHQGGCCSHWNRHGGFCRHCGPIAEPMESEVQPGPIEGDHQ